MGEVYRARDVRLGRTVAIKVLPADVSSDPERLRRFESEARAASALSHPNILAVYDVGAADSISYIAMECVEGKTLGELLLLGPLPVRKLLDIAVSIAEGLSSAHEAGIIHRDLKPSNVIVSKEGHVKVLDFGLAKLEPTASGPADATETTEVFTPTEPGTVVGTAGYMSPEQAGGKPLDFRSDQFAFGSILYEMATGRRAFRGETPVDTLVAILRGEPEPIGKVNSAIPAPLRWIVERCLAKSPADRFASTRDLSRDLSSLRDHLSEIGAPSPGEGLRVGSPAGVRPWSWFLWWLIPLFLAVVLLATFWPRRPPSAPVMRLSVLPPPKASFNFATSAPAPAAISSDGREIVFGARDSSGQSLLWVRSLDGLTARPLAGTEGATYPFWSPDGRSIGYFANGKIKKIAASGGAPQTLCDASDGRGGSWSREGVILFAPEGLGRIYRVPETGGEPTAVTKLPPGVKGVTHRWPSFLPDGRHFLYLARDTTSPARKSEVRISSLDSRLSDFLLKGTSNAIYATSGHLLFVREGALLALPFDAKQLRSTGPPTTVVEEVEFHPYRWNGIFSVSETGVLVFQAGRLLDLSRLAWFDRSGKEIGQTGPLEEFAGLRLSPDGRLCAVEVRDSRAGTIDIWIADIARGILTRLTRGGGISDSPTWSPDGARLAFASNRTGEWKLYAVSAEGEGEAVVLDHAGGLAPNDWSSDGKLLLLNASAPVSGAGWDLWTLKLPDGRTDRLLREAFNETSGRFSPDGHWLAYASDESGPTEVYVRHLRGSGQKKRVSGGGGNQPVWRRDGRELFYLSADNRIMAVEVRPGASLEIGNPVPLFRVRVKASASDIPVFDASADGQRFVVNSLLEEEGRAPLTAVLNWTQALKR